ncbi:NnrS family protein [Sulfurospirillum sp. 1612]|uniref:NnrS family protein n=1 Tax=Sulfurospirillum sp. 1612 TaxID=3094835 RepID=UPI002F91ECEC
MFIPAQKKQNYFLSQPHQPFFVLGVINAIIMMLLFALNYKGVLALQISNLLFHTYSLIFLVFLNVFIGFLLTTFPKFNHTHVVKKSFYLTIFYANVLGSILFLLGALLFKSGVILAIVLLMISQIFIVLKLQNIYEISQATNKSDSFWILVSSYLGILGNLLFGVSLVIPVLQKSAITISFYLFVIFLTFSVAQRMVPAFSQSTAAKNKNFVAITFLLFIMMSIFRIFEFTIAEIFVDFALFVYLLREFLRWRLHPLRSPAILWILHLALFWFPFSFLFSALSFSAELLWQRSFYFLGVHLLALGFLTTILIGFGTRVIYGHSGQVIHADKMAIFLFYFTQFLVLARALYSVNIAFGWDMNFLFDISFSAWLVLFIFWGGRYGRILLFGSKTKHIVKWS